MTLSCFTCFKCFLVSLYLFVIVYNIWYASILYQVTQSGDAKNVISSSEKEENMSRFMQHAFAATYAYIAIVFIVLQSYKLILCYVVSLLLLALGFILSDATNRLSGPLSCIALLCIAIVYLLRHRQTKLQSLDYIEVPSRSYKSRMLHVLLVILYLMSMVCLILFTQEQTRQHQQINNIIHLASENDATSSQSNDDWRRELVSKCGYLLTGIVGVFFATALCNLLALREDVMQNLAMLLAMLLLSFVVGNSRYVNHILAIAFFAIITSIYGQSVANLCPRRYNKYNRRSDLLEETSFESTSTSPPTRKSRETRANDSTPGDSA